MKNISEERTRKERIDPQLERAGWYLRDHSKVRIEIPVDGYDAAPWNGVTDYCLYRENGEALAVVEAKKTAVDVRLAEAQLTHYVTEIEKHQSFRPFGFLANGREIYFVDVGNAPKREVFGFFTREDLENLLYIRQNAKPLSSIEINNSIVDRSYQHEAIRRVCEAFETVPKVSEPSGRSGGKRKALIVMATGTGKTRTTMGLIDVFMRANQARRVLFVADRDALVEQAIDDGFQKYLPTEPCTRLRSWNVETSQRLYAVTLQTLSNIFEQFSPAFFDLIVFDEVHRSIFNKFNEVLEYFDGRQIGLTATPANYINRDTFLAFDCTDGKPTYLYTYEQAIEDGYLVDYELYAARTKFQREGIHGVDLTEEERNALIEKGIDPDDINFEGTELERTVTNFDTIRRQWEEIWEVCKKDASGQLPGKTIVFAVTQEHALRLQKIFDEMYPQFPELTKVITHKSEYRGKLVEAFKKEDMPRIAISVDMLDTGIDVPEVVNLVFMKPVQSPIKLQQMIGRGTRPQAACRNLALLPNFEKKGFLVIDFWENNFSRDAKEVADQSTPVLVTIFNTRLKLLETYLNDQQNPDCRQVIADLRGQIQQIPTDSFTIRKHMPEIEEAWTDAYWDYLIPSKIDFLRVKVAPHLRLVPGVDVAAATFISKVERLKLLKRTNKEASGTIQSIVEDAQSLRDTILSDVERKAKSVCVPEKLVEFGSNELNLIRDTLAPRMKNKARYDTFLELDLVDSIAISGYILLSKSGEKMYVAEYRRLVEERILKLVANHPTIKAIQNGEDIDDWQLLELERTLTKELGESDLEVTLENLTKVFSPSTDSFLDLVRQALDMQSLPDYKDLVTRQFEKYTIEHKFNADQIRFLRAVQSVFLQKRRLETADLYDAPALVGFGQDAVERWFTEQEVSEIVVFANRLAVNQSQEEE
ncbi:MAG: DEAD/DEAH box helicase family protein [Anaerolineales bacterium]|nr:DEAD/DEAH box helicase family protein [Anaerolineales bacterium]